MQKKVASCHIKFRKVLCKWTFLIGKMFETHATLAALTILLTCGLQGTSQGLGCSDGIFDGRTDNSCSPSAPKIICYFTNWSLNRTGESRFNLSYMADVHAQCTHIIYSFVVLSPTTFTMEMSIPEIDSEPLNMYEKITSLKSKGVKVGIALGGWKDSEDGEKYSTMVNSGVIRTRFVHDAVNFLRRHNFDGLDLDWEYPRCWHGNCSRGPIPDRNNFANLVQELKIAFRFYGFFVSVAVSGDPEIVKKAYHMKRLGGHADWIGLMTYDLFSFTRGKTGHHSPYMGPHPNTVDALDLWLQMGVPSHKLVVGIPFHGRSFTLLDSSFHGVGAPATQGKAAPFTSEPGYIGYFEFCDSKNFPVKQIPGVASYAVKDDQWISFNDKDIIQQKVRHVIQYSFGGVMIWALDLDDFSGECHDGKYPLMSSIRSAFNLTM